MTLPTGYRLCVLSCQSLFVQGVRGLGRPPLVPLCSHYSRSSRNRWSWSVLSSCQVIDVRLTPHCGIKRGNRRWLMWARRQHVILWWKGAPLAHIRTHAVALYSVSKLSVKLALIWYFLDIGKRESIKAWFYHSSQHESSKSCTFPLASALHHATAIV